MDILILIDDAPHGTEKAYNGFRLAMALQKEHPEVMSGKTRGVSIRSERTMIVLRAGTRSRWFYDGS